MAFPENGRTDTEDSDDSSHAVFRETFLQDALMPESIAVFREFSKHVYDLLLEGCMRRYESPAEARAAELTAVAADLTNLANHLHGIGTFYDKEGYEDPSEWVSPRDLRWSRYAVEISRRLADVVKDIEAEIKAGREETPD